MVIAMYSHLHYTNVYKSIKFIIPFIWLYYYLMSNGCYVSEHISKFFDATPVAHIQRRRTVCT